MMVESKIDEVDLGALLQRATAEPPASRLVDLRQAREEGAKKLRRRRAITVAGSGSAVVAVIVAAATLIGGPTSPRPVQPGADPSTATVTAPLSTDRFDPLRLRFAAGWLPEGMSNAMELSHVTSQRLSFDKLGPLPREGSDDINVTITGYATGVAPSRLGLFRVSGAEQDVPIAALLPPGDQGPSVNGSASVWYPGGRTLAWQWAPGAWATVYLQGPIDGPLLDVAVHVATTVRTDVDEAMALPFTVAAPPAPLRLIESVVGPNQTDLVFSDVDDLYDPATGASRELRVAVMKNDALTVEKLGAPTETIDGHPAHVTSDANGFDVLLLGVNGTWVNVTANHAVTMTYVDKDAGIELARGVRVVPNFADRSTWSTSPVR